MSARVCIVCGRNKDVAVRQLGDVKFLACGDCYKDGFTQREAVRRASK